MFDFYKAIPFFFDGSTVINEPNGSVLEKYLHERFWKCSSFFRPNNVFVEKKRVSCPLLHLLWELFSAGEGS